MIKKLQEYGIKESLIDELIYFRKHHDVDTSVKNRVEEPSSFYYGRKIWEMSIYALLNGQNLLLVGNKATGKNILADNLSFAFGRPKWTISFHNYTDADDLIGVDTYKDSEVIFRKGIISQCATYGGFGVLDEINMAKNDALSVLYSSLDYRKTIDISGYDKIDLHDATRFIATINYGYLGTKELSEALVSRFAVIQMPKPNNETIKEILKGQFDKIDEKIVEIIAKVFIDIQLKSENSEISSRAVDLRGLIDSLKLIKKGMSPKDALEICLINKIFDSYERQIVKDVVDLRVDEDLKWI